MAVIWKKNSQLVHVDYFSRHVEDIDIDPVENNMVHMISEANRGDDQTIEGGIAVLELHTKLPIFYRFQVGEDSSASMALFITLAVFSYLRSFVNG